MTAMSAPRSAFETATTTATASAPPTREIRLPGSSRTYELRDILRGMGLRWDPCSHSWHGRLTDERRALLERDLHLPVQTVVPIEAFPTAQEEEVATRRPEPPRGPSGPSPRPGGLSARPVARDGSRTRAEALVVFPGEEPDPSASSHGRFTLLDITSGIPDDSREADERAAARRLADLRGRGRAARRALVAAPRADEAMRADWRKEAAFLARFGVTQAQLKSGVLATAVELADADAVELLGHPNGERVEAATRAVATIPAQDGEG